jgi:hypothetical protein
MPGGAMACGCSGRHVNHRRGAHTGPLLAVPWYPGIMKIHVGVTLEDLRLIFGRFGRYGRAGS